MSILRCLSQAAPHAPGSAAILWLLGPALVSLAVGVIAGAIPPRKAGGPDRIPPEQSPWMLLAVFFGAVAVYLFTARVYVSFTAGARGPHLSPAHQRPVDIAFLSIGPALAGFVALLLGDRAARVVIGQDLGIGIRRFPAGFMRGLLGALIVIPPLFLLENVLELIYQLIHYSHPKEHPLLHVLAQRPGHGVVAAIVVGACVIAPLFEELIFRGHIQTLIRQLLSRLTKRSDGAPSRIAPAWGAIIITSALFASIHPLWSQPIIFVLALALGYAYERTGNLWVSITVHAAFNTISTVIFLLTLSSH